MKETKSCSILIPHYNNNDGLIRSLLSCAKSTLHPFILIVDDGSHIKPDLEQCRSFYENLDILYLHQNVGIVGALNAGLNYLMDRGFEFIGRLDSGDTVSTDRFEKQISFLNLNPRIALVGSWVDNFDSNGNVVYTLKTPTTYQDIKKKMHLNSMFSHPSVMFRSKVIQELGIYSPEFPSAEDYEFFFRIMQQYEVANIPECLTQMEINFNSISYSRRREQLRSRLKVQYLYLNRNSLTISLYGIGRTLALFITPFKLIKHLKRKFGKVAY